MLICAGLRTCNSDKMGLKILCYHSSLASAFELHYCSNLEYTASKIIQWPKNFLFSAIGLYYEECLRRKRYDCTEVLRYSSLSFLKK